MTLEKLFPDLNPSEVFGDQESNGFGEKSASK